MSDLRLAGAPNFRDLGGLPAADGRRIRPGTLFRSSALHALSDEDVEAVAALGVKLVCDLRSPPERERDTSRLPAPVPAMLVPDIGFETKTGFDIDEVLEDDSIAWATAYIEDVYSSFPAVSAPTLRELFSRLLAGQYPVIIHCMAGKDRTGFIVAVVLLALGVPREVIGEDYLLTDRYFGFEPLRRAMVELLGGREPDPALVDIYRAQLPRLELAIEAIGEVDEYLERDAGLTPDRRRRLIELLTEPA